VVRNALAMAPVCLFLLVFWFGVSCAGLVACLVLCLVPLFDQEILSYIGLNIWFLFQIDLLTATIVTMSAPMDQRRTFHYESTHIESFHCETTESLASQAE